MLDFLHRLLGRKTGPEPTAVRSVGDALAVEPGQPGQSLRDAVAAINRVHRDGKLPVIPVTRASFTDRHAQFTNVAGKIAIEINRITGSAGLATVHEIGHFLDYSGLGNSGEWASEADGVLDRWRAAVKESRSIQRLRPLLEAGVDQAAETLTGGTVVEYEVNRAYLRYMLQPRELWARSYAQFITAKSGDPILRRQMDDLRNQPTNKFYYGEQWEDEDFLPILASIEAIFHDLGWM